MFGSAPSSVVARVISFLCIGTFCCGADTPDTEPAWKSGLHTLNIDGRDRNFILDVPRNLKPGSPLVMVYHGYGGNASAIRQKVGFTKIAEKNGVVVVYPDGTRDAKNKTFFQVGYDFTKDLKVDDVSFSRQLAARLVDDLSLDPLSVFVTGFSNGGDISFLLGCQQKPFVRAIAPVAGTMMVSWESKLPLECRISVLAVNAIDDKVTFWDGDLENCGGWGPYISTNAVVDFWVKGLALETKRADDISAQIRLRAWNTTMDDAEFKLYEIATGGHTWPSHLGNEEASTAEVIWQFFESHRPKTGSTK